MDLKVDDLHIDNLIYDNDKSLKNSLINISRRHQKDTLIAVTSDNIDGSLLMPQKTTTPWRLVVKHAKLPDILAEDAGKSDTKTDLLDQISPMRCQI